MTAVQSPTEAGLAGLRLAVTGASGFCGGAVARAALAAGAEVVGLSRRPTSVPGVAHRPWDAAVDAPDLRGVDAVIHVAATVSDPPPGADESAHMAVNVDGGRRLLDAAGDRPVVWVSSASVYDPRVDRRRVTETHPTGGGHLNAYGRTKAAGDALALDAGASVVRPRAVYGPGDTHLLPRLRRAVRAGRVVVPGPDVLLSITHVDSLAGACLAALDWPPAAYNIADPTPVSRDTMLCAVLGAVLGRHVTPLRLPLPMVEAAARVACASARVTGREPLLTPYAVDLLASSVVLDVTRAREAGWHPTDRIGDYVRALGRAAAPV